MSVVGVGIDLAAIARLDDVRRRRPTIDARIFTAGERELLAHAGPVEAAQAFALKEAVMKALGRGVDGISFTEIDTTDRVELHGRALRRATELGIEAWEKQVGVIDGPGGQVALAEVVAHT